MWKSARYSLHSKIPPWVVSISDCHSSKPCLMISIFLSEQFLRHSEPIGPLEISTFPGNLEISRWQFTTHRFPAVPWVVSGSPLTAPCPDWQELGLGRETKPRRGGKTDGKLRRQRPFPRTLSATTDAALGIRRAGNLQVQPFFREEKVKLKTWILWWSRFQVQGDCVKSPQTTKTNKKQWNWRDFL